MLKAYNYSHCDELTQLEYKLKLLLSPIDGLHELIGQRPLWRS